jgi:hypothetical protein
MEILFCHILYLCHFLVLLLHTIQVNNHLTSIFVVQELISQDGLFSSNKEVQSAALRSLSTFMTITPNETFLEFEKVILSLSYPKWKF